MAGVGIEVIDEATPLLREFGKRLADFRPTLRVAGQYMFKETIRQFQTEGARSGDNWPPLKPATIKRRRKHSSAILQDTGRLRSSVISPAAKNAVYELTKSDLTIGTNLEYAAIHQWGGDIQRTVKPGSTILTRSRKTPTGWSFTSRRRMLRLTSGKRPGMGFKYVRWAGGKSYMIHIPQRKFLVVTQENLDKIAWMFHEGIGR